MVAALPTFAAPAVLQQVDAAGRLLFACLVLLQVLLAAEPQRLQPASGHDSSFLPVFNFAVACVVMNMHHLVC